eukprot:755262-Hanusia_phi.AAC.2
MKDLAVLLLHACRVDPRESPAGADLGGGHGEEEAGDEDPAGGGGGVNEVEVDLLGVRAPGTRAVEAGSDARGDGAVFVHQDRRILLVPLAAELRQRDEVEEFMYLL